MNIEVAFRAPMRRWQQQIVAALQADGHEVSLSAGGSRRMPLTAKAALTVQQRILGPNPSLFDTIAASREAGACKVGSYKTDLTLALDGVGVEADSDLEPLFGGRTGQDALLDMLIRGVPEVRLRARDKEGVYDIVTARLALEEPSVLSRSLDQALARIVTLTLQAVRRLDRSEAGCDPPAAATDGLGISPIMHVARGLTRKVKARLSRADRGPNHWRIAYRQGCEGAPALAWSDRGYQLLPDEPGHFYADPFAFEHEGRGYVFFEDYPYATGKGVVAVVEVDAAGGASKPRTVLERPCHLSYPHLIRHRGEIYMLPETSGARCVQLFRADPFPDRWIPDRVLVDDVVAADATPIEHDGRWWLFATSSDDGGSSWDQLCLFHAPDLLGPWTPHAGNPVLVDAGAARPAGAMWHQDGVLMRVAQDCRHGYGVGLAICRVDRLDAAAYEQSVVARLAPPAGYGADGVHTLNRAGGLEVIDLRFLPL